MIRLLVKHFIGNGQADDPAVREKYGTLAGCVGIGLNILLFLAKYVAGVISGSIAITADAFNNLSDAGSSIVTLLGFKYANKKPDLDHRFGHGRFEYIAGLIVSLAIIMMGFSLLKESVQRIFYPGVVAFSWLAVAILGASILVKLYMASYNRMFARAIDSVAMRATAIDSLSDAGATSVVLASTLIARYTGLAIDGWAGTAVALLILWAGISAARDTISPLLGNPPDAALVKKITDIVRSCDIVTGMHDLVVHDYGAGRRMISLHAEVPASGDIMATHDAIDLIERRLARELNCHAVIHMDPIATDDALVAEVRDRVLAALRAQFGDLLTVHDFRMVTGPTHTNVIFDAVLPPEAKLSAEDAKAKIAQIVEALDGNYYAVVTVDLPYVV